MELEQMEKSESQHALYDKWVYWAHLPHDTDWTLKSYIKICELETVEDVISIDHCVPDQMIQNCMLFVMRKNINPTWEDSKNENGGCFSFKISNKIIVSVWNKILYLLTGETLSNDHNFLKSINGITLSPKKSFCILKLWMCDLKQQNPKKIAEIEGLNMHGCLFKKHK